VGIDDRSRADCHGGHAWHGHGTHTGLSVDQPVLATLVVAGFLLGHGLVHACFLMPRPPADSGGPAWPFDLADSWVLTPTRVQPVTIRRIALILVSVIVATFTCAAITAPGLLPAGGWVPLVTVGSCASLSLLGLGFHRWLAIGVGIDLVLLWAVVVAAWVPQPL
jgi:hypothetical protein